MAGETIETAIKILMQDPKQGALSEYYYMEKQFGKMGKDWTKISQTSLGKDGKMFDEMEIRVNEGKLKGKKRLYFDITAFFNKWGKEKK